MADEKKPHAFKGRAASYKGDRVTVIRGAHAGDVDAGVELKTAHYLVAKEDGTKEVAPVAKVKILPVEED